ncbi:Arabinogalactan peptide 16 [Acorus gramineus]|uniref:Arabinogalactan peptide 16 n=1 Tax=Acorus gramineus TaxID=55184 RepID=A0AAV9AL52_ACOGR|nr:Arabinogalactan peptide 16 [Acorus gramineus]
MNSLVIRVLIFIAFIFSGLMHLSHGQVVAPSPTTARPTSDGNRKAIDQGIAYILMIIALIVTYLAH